MYTDESLALEAGGDICINKGQGIHWKGRRNKQKQIQFTLSKHTYLPTHMRDLISPFFPFPYTAIDRETVTHTCTYLLNVHTVYYTDRQPDQIPTNGKTTPLPPPAVEKDPAATVCSGGFGGLRLTEER